MREAQAPRRGTDPGPTGGTRRDFGGCAGVGEEGLVVAVGANSSPHRRYVVISDGGIGGGTIRAIATYPITPDAGAMRVHAWPRGS